GQRIEAAEYFDSFGNKCSRFVVPAGIVRLTGSSIVEMEDATDPIAADAQQWPMQDLPNAVLQFLLPSRYCEVDRFVQVAPDLFGGFTPAWPRADGRGPGRNRCGHHDVLRKR